MKIVKEKKFLIFLKKTSRSRAERLNNSYWVNQYFLGHFVITYFTIF